VRDHYNERRIKPDHVNLNTLVIYVMALTGRKAIIYLTILMMAPIEILIAGRRNE
jgi:hypothetical protein